MFPDVVPVHLLRAVSASHCDAMLTHPLRRRGGASTATLSAIAICYRIDHHAARWKHVWRCADGGVPYDCDIAIRRRIQRRLGGMLADLDLSPLTEGRGRGRMANQDKTIARMIKITEAVSSRARITSRVGLIPNIRRTVIHRVSLTS
jgi:hypothetical protein